MRQLSGPRVRGRGWRVGQTLSARILARVLETSRGHQWLQNVNFAASWRARELLDQASEGLLKAALEAVR